MEAGQETDGRTAQAVDVNETRVWLVCNPDSGSNDAEALEALQDDFRGAGFHVERLVRFPDEDAPCPEDLDRAGVGLLAVFAGDGTTHAVISGAADWSGPVLVLPGGTMNMLSKRLHGDVAPGHILQKLTPGRLDVSRPSVIASRHGVALTGVLAGPGTVWNEVREAMRSRNLIEFLSTTSQAISWSTSGPKVRCDEVDCGRKEGYAAITVTPQDRGLQVNGYYAESLADYAGQGIALLNRNFRNGPHDDLGLHARVRLVCTEGEPMGLLLDGEPFDGTAEEEFEMTACKVDLVTTKNG